MYIRFLKGDDLFLDNFNDQHDEKQRDFGAGARLSNALLHGSPVTAVPVPTARLCDAPNSGNYTIIQSHILIE